jgi:hypothetical protein
LSDETREKRRLGGVFDGIERENFLVDLADLVDFFRSDKK